MQIKGKLIADNAIVEAKIANLAVTSEKINNLAVTEGKIGSSAVTEGKIDTGAVTVDKIGALAVTEGKIGTGAVIESKIGAGAVVEGKIGALAVTEGKIGSGAVTTGKIGNDAVDSAKIADDAVDSEHVADDAINNMHLSTDAKQGVLESKYAAAFNKSSYTRAVAATTSDIITDEVFNASTSPTQTFLPEGSSSQLGVITSSPNNKVILRDRSNGDPIEDTSNRQVFGRQTVAFTNQQGSSTFTNGSISVLGNNSQYTTTFTVGDFVREATNKTVYRIVLITDDTHMDLDRVYEGGTVAGATAQKVIVTLSYYVWNGTVEVAHTMPNTMLNIDILYTESMSFYNLTFAALLNGVSFAETLPAEHSHTGYVQTSDLADTTSPDSGGTLVGIDTTNVVGSSDDDVQGVFEDIAQYPRYEKKTISAQDTIPDLTYTPKDVTSVILIVEGVPQRYGSSYDYVVASKTFTWSFANSGFHIEAGDEVWVQYNSVD